MIRKRRLVGAAAALVMACGFGAFAVESTGAPPATQEAATQVAGKGAAPAFAAMSYYDDNCSRCHGPQGSFYGPTLGKDLTDAGLLKEVKDMAEGPGAAPLEPAALEVETAYHRALILHSPFVSVTGMAEGKWTGEVMPGAKVVVTAGGKRVEAQVTDWNWSVQLPRDVQASEVTVTAELKGKRTTLHPMEEMYSHRTPLSEPAKR